MCNVRPFCGLRYNLQLVPDPSAVITPPYDVISPEERTSYYRISPYNIIRLEFGEERPGDSPDNNKYTRAAATLNDWLRDGILIRDKKPALYIVEHRFLHHDTEKSRWGLVCRVQLEDYENGQIRPHEQTTEEPAVDRLNLLRTCQVNISPIIGLVRSEEGEMTALLRGLSGEEPDMSTTGNNETKCHLRIVTDQSAIDEVSRLLADKVIYIADGHHRYETALRYRKERCSSHPSCTGDEPFNFVMISLIDSQDPGLVMSPTHRLVQGLESHTLVQLKEKLSPYFETEDLLPPLSTLSETIQSWLHTLETSGEQGVALGLYGLDEQKLCLLKLRQNANLPRVMDTEERRLWGDSDVVLLQRIVFQEVLGIDTRDKEAAHLKYMRGAPEAASKVDSGEYQLAFFLNPAPLSSIFHTADAGRRLPQKSTYFHPKTPAGLVMNPVWDE
ncbi:MAG: DUF1015 domain-containing protein [Dehalococcoidia bacterium]